MIVKSQLYGVEVIFETLINIKKMMANKFPEKPLVIILHLAGSIDVEMEKVKHRKMLVEDRSR